MCAHYWYLWTCATRDIPTAKTQTHWDRQPPWLNPTIGGCVEIVHTDHPLTATQVLLCESCQLDENYSDQGLQVHMPKSLAVSQAITLTKVCRYICPRALQSVKWPLSGPNHYLMVTSTGMPQQTLWPRLPSSHQPGGKRKPQTTKLWPRVR